MNTKVTVTERIGMLELHSGSSSLRGLATRLGLKTPQIFYDIRSGKVSGFSSELTSRILLEFPEIRRDWLVYGEGPMTADEKSAMNDGVFPTGDFLKIFLNMSNTISRQEENITKLTGMVEKLVNGPDTPKLEKV